MTRALRIALRLITLVLAISLVTFVLVGGFWFMWQDARGRAPRVGYRITVEKIEQTAMGLYLSTQRDVIENPVDPDDDRATTFVIEPGESVSSVAWRLEENGLVQDASLFRRLSQFEQADSSIEAGVFTLRRNMTMREVLEALQHGREVSDTVTIPEGWRAEEIAALLEQSGVTTAADFLAAVQAGRDDYPFLTDRLEGAAPSLEGYLFPDTYNVPIGTPVETVLDLMLTNFGARVTEEMRQQANAQGLTVHELLTLASIVEREARVPDERPLIARVYLNRLAAGMALQADPTVQYAKGFDSEAETWWSVLTTTDLELNSPYNTYLVENLPPGPICNPGLASIQAVLEPADVDYMFFVAKGDDGSHAFSVTYEEHLQNVQQYRSGN